MLRHREQNAAARPASLAKLAESAAIVRDMFENVVCAHHVEGTREWDIQRIDAQARASGKGVGLDHAAFRKGLRDPARNVTGAAPDFEVVSHAWEPPLQGVDDDAPPGTKPEVPFFERSQNPQVVRVVTDARGHRFSHSTIACE